MNSFQKRTAIQIASVSMFLTWFVALQVF